jgi:hypothetical protein
MNSKVPDCVPEEVQLDEKSQHGKDQGKDREGGLNRKGIALIVRTSWF